MFRPSHNPRELLTVSFHFYPGQVHDSLFGGSPMSPSGVTIAIPNWNHEYVLPRAVASGLQAVQVLRGHDVPAEVLVIDDQSRDGSLTLLRQLEALLYDRGLRVLAFRHNGGLSMARNRALHYA